MSYKETLKKRKVNRACARMRDGMAEKLKAYAKEVGPRVEFEPKKIRRWVIVIDFDFGIKFDFFRFEKTNRIDSYFVVHNGLRSEKMGWSVFCKRLSTHFPRLLSRSALE